MNFKEYISQKKKERFIKTLTSDTFKDFFDRNAKPLQKMFTYYECAMMEVETKFNVLNQEFLHTDVLIEPGHRNSFNIGYLFLQHIYYQQTSGNL